MWGGIWIGCIVGRTILTLDTTIPWASILEWIKRRKKLRTSALSLPPECDCNVASSLISCHHALPTMVDCILKLWAKANLSAVSWFVRLFCYSNKKSSWWNVKIVCPSAIHSPPYLWKDRQVTVLVWWPKEGAERNGSLCFQDTTWMNGSSLLKLVALFIWKTFSGFVVSVIPCCVLLDNAKKDVPDMVPVWSQQSVGCVRRMQSSGLPRLCWESFHPPSENL